MNRNITQNLSNTKSQLRERFLGIRKELTGAEVWKKSEIIGQKLLNIPEVAAARSISAYLPIKNEVTTKSIIDALVARGANVYLPTYDKPLLSSSRKRGSDFGYVFSRFNDWEDLVPGPHGILQPSLPRHHESLIRHPELDSGSLDVAIVPGLAFDKKGVRLGYGEGVFDKLLSDSPALKIGLAYDFQIVKSLPFEKHDLKIDIIVTEENIKRVNFKP